MSTDILASLKPSADIIQADVERALAEDLGSGDLTADLLAAEADARAQVICREAAVIAGQPWFERCFMALDRKASVRWHVREGARVEAGTRLCTIEGRARALVSAERCALNFMQTLSGTATETARYVAAVQGTGAQVLDTRKTLPGLRLAQKYAVRCGGGGNHRLGLFDAMLLKENHLAAAGGIAAAVTRARQLHPHAPLEVEVESIDQLEAALAAGVDRIMLDEFTPTMIADAVRRNRGRVALEVSGNVDLHSLRAIADMGVDYISVGALTKHIRAIDLSMRFEDA